MGIVLLMWISLCVIATPFVVLLIKYGGWWAYAICTLLISSIVKTIADGNY